MPHPLHKPPEMSSQSDNGRSEAATIIVTCAARRLEEHPFFRGRSNVIHLEFDQGAIVLTGQVPSFYLKQLLQEAMRNIDGVETIDNRVDVVCSNGLSSAGAR